jgi:hypothetical protein
MNLILQTNMQGWAGWCGGLLYRADDPNATTLEVDVALQAKAKAIGRSAAILSQHGSLYGWGYTDTRYLNGGYWWPFFIESDQFRRSNVQWEESRLEVRDPAVVL